MANQTYDPYAADQVELRDRELKAQQDRARLLFHCYALAEDEDEDPESDDAYIAYYDEASLHER